MKTRASLLIAVVAILSEITWADDDPASTDPGRYQLVAADHGLYFLDTATGTLWLQTPGDRWRKVPSPVDKEVPARKIRKPPKRKVTLDLPESGVTMPMTQREVRTIPGSSDTLKVCLGDITGGQVFVEVIDANGDFVVERTSLKRAEFLKFKVGKSVYFLQITEMVNNLIGTDICKVHISDDEPVVENETPDGDAENPSAQPGEE